MSAAPGDHWFEACILLSMARKPLASAAVLLLLLIVPLLDGIVSASARKCGKAPCCAGKRHCPMHPSDDASRSSCSFGSCGEGDVSLAAMPPIIDCEANELRCPEAPAALMIDGETAAIIDRSAPPDPPPPRRLG